MACLQSKSGDEALVFYGPSYSKLFTRVLVVSAGVALKQRLKNKNNKNLSLLFKVFLNSKYNENAQTSTKYITHSLTNHRHKVLEQHLFSIDIYSRFGDCFSVKTQIFNMILGRCFDWDGPVESCISLLQLSPCPWVFMALAS